MADVSKAEKSNKELLEALGVELAPAKKAAHSPREERIIAGFEEIQRFVEEHGHRPAHSEGNDIFERLYATRLEQIQRQEDCRNLVAELDYQGLLNSDGGIAEPTKQYSTDEELLADLGVSPKDGDITVLKHVKPRAEVKAAEEVATRIACVDFDKFKTLFDTVQQELKSGVREAKLLARQPEIETGDWFILQGQKAYVEKVGEEFINDNGHKEARLRVIFDNGTESNLFMRSLQKALKQDEAGRRIIEISHGPLFASVSDKEDTASGIIYVLRSKSDHPVIAENRQLVHKIGVTGGSVKTRIANAKVDPTYLMADVEIVATYELYNISRTKLEGLLHRFFESSRLDIQISDRFGKPVVPREWFLVPLFIIDEVVERIKDGTLDKYYYDASKAQLVSD
jgi:hypothetical protein